MMKISLKNFFRCVFVAKFFFASSLFSQDSLGIDCEKFFHAIKENDFDAVFRYSIHFTHQAGQCTNEREENAMHIFAKHGRNQLLFAPLLYNAKATVNAIDNEGRTPLMLAALYGNDASAITMLFNCTDRPALNEVDHHGRTALHYAYQSGLGLLIKTLIDFGADQSIRDKESLLAHQLQQKRSPAIKTKTNFSKAMQEVIWGFTFISTEYSINS